MSFITVAKGRHDPDSHIQRSGECSDLTPPISRYSALAQAANSICKLLGLGPYLSKTQGITHAPSDRGRELIVYEGHLRERSWSPAHKSSVSGLDTNAGIPPILLKIPLFLHVNYIKVASKTLESV